MKTSSTTTRQDQLHRMVREHMQRKASQVKVNAHLTGAFAESWVDLMARASLLELGSEHVLGMLLQKSYQAVKQVLEDILAEQSQTS
jgi:hypothetical protein